MNNKLKGLVSKKKKRYQKDGFDLDLTYVTSQIIAMGFPAQSFEGLYRNHIDDVVRFFKSKHDKNFRIYNLCNERHIDEEKFEGDSINHSYPFNDHNPPMFSQMIACIDNIEEYLKANEKNVVAIQCKAGKGRTGVIVCACLLKSGNQRTAKEALVYYGYERTTNGKGVTIPSQIRYIFYYEHFLHIERDTEYTDFKLHLEHLILDESPVVIGNNNELQVLIYGYTKQKTDCLTLLDSSSCLEHKRETRGLKFTFGIDLLGDIKFELIMKNKFGKKEKLCHCWLNTFFVVHKPPITSLIDSFRTTSPVFLHSSGAADQTASFKMRKHSQLPHFSIDTNHSGGNNSSFSNHSSNCLNPESTAASASGCGRSRTPSGDEALISTFKVNLSKHEIDKANKDTTGKVFPKNFSISFLFTQCNSQHNESHNQAANTSPPNQQTPPQQQHPNRRLRTICSLSPRLHGSPEHSDNQSVSSESSSESRK